jgi:hypothetical protein
MLNVIAVGTLVLSFFAAPAADVPSAESAVPTERIILDVQTVNGSGCPAGTADVTASADNTAFTVAYDEFAARDGSGAGATDFRRNCQINVLVHVPSGFTFAIARADYRGYAHLPSGASATQLAHYYFSGESATATTSHDFDGPMSGQWQVTDRAAVATFTRCGVDTNLNINAELRVNSGPSNHSSIITMDSTRGSVRTLFHLDWKHC